jgi:hypothetical protein
MGGLAVNNGKADRSGLFCIEMWFGLQDDQGHSYMNAYNQISRQFSYNLCVERYETI